MKAAVYYEHGGPEVFRYEDVPDPVCHRKGIVIRVEAVSVEGGDLLDRSGNLSAVDPCPHVVGRQAAGVVVEVGSEVEGFAVGQKAVAARPNGSHAELFAAPARTSWVIPDGLETFKAAAVPVAFGTAHEALFHFGQMQPGDTVLVQAGSSGVGLAAIQIARRAGAGRILATGSSDERLARLRPLGLNDAINYRRVDVAEEVRRLTDGKGVDIVIDTVGGDTMQGSIQSLAFRGRLVAAGQASRAPVNVDLARLYTQGLTVVGLKLDIAGPRVHGIIGDLLAGCARGDYQVFLDRSFPLSEAAAAHAYIENRSAFGRVLLIP